MLEYVFIGIAPEQTDRTIDGICLYTRKQVIDGLLSGKRFVIGYRREGIWQRGGDLRLVMVNETPYVRTDNQTLPIDDVGNIAKIHAAR